MQYKCPDNQRHPADGRALRGSRRVIHSTVCTYSVVESRYYFFLSRERKEHQVYLALLGMVPGLEERLMSGDTEMIHRCAMLVSQKCEAYNFIDFDSNEVTLYSYRRGPLAQDRMIQKV